MKPFSVLIDSSSSLENSEVADHVSKHKAREDQTRKGHDDFFADGGGLTIFTTGTGRHSSKVKGKWTMPSANTIVSTCSIMPSIWLICSGVLDFS